MPSPIFGIYFGNGYGESTAVYERELFGTRGVLLAAGI